MIEKFKLRTIDLIGDINDSDFGGKISMDHLIIASETRIWKKIYHKQIFFIFSLRVYLTILYQKYYKVTVDKHEKNIFRHVLCGYIGSLLTLLIQTKYIA